MTFKSFWKYGRVVLFIVWFVLLAATCLLGAVALALGNPWILVFQFISFVIGFVIQELERRAGWVDDFYRWIE